MENKLLEKQLDKLSHLEEVEVSPFLITRIESRIQQKESELVPASKLTFIALGTALVLLINVAIVYQWNKRTNDSETQNYGLTTFYSIY